MTDIPEIEDTGSTGTQKLASTEMLVPEPELVFRPTPVVATVVQGLAATRARSMGGEVAAHLLSASFTQTYDELAETKLELKQARQELSETKQELSDTKIREAVLGERVSEVTRGQHLRNFAIFVGTVLLGIAFNLYESEASLPILMGILGIALVLMGWLWPTTGSRR